MRLAIQIYQRVLLSSEKVKIFHLGKKKKLHAEVAMIYCKNESSVQKFGRKEKGIHDSFVAAPQTTKVAVIGLKA
jgi:hypothetical protein